MRTRDISAGPTPLRGSTRRRLEGRVAVVTGAASGIGKALASALIGHGATVVFTDVDEAAAKTAADSVGAGPPGRASSAVLDVRDSGAFDELTKNVVGEHGHIDLLFNNAGVGVSGEVLDMSAAHWDRVLEVNLRGVVNGVRAVYPTMVQQGHGHIVNTASLAGLIPAPRLTPYAMTKHAVVGLSTSLRAEAARHNVRVSVICPGVINTPLLDTSNPSDLPQVPSAPNGRALLQRTIGKAYPPEELAEDVLRGVVRNRPFIVAPRHARIPWRLYRAFPSFAVDVTPRLMARALRRAGNQP